MAEITVIVPVYKVEKYICRCVDSILAQSFHDFELVLVDDGSPDACPQICDRYAQKDKRITVIHKQNGGLSDARNAGIDWAMEHSSSAWLAFADSDDYLHPDYLRILHETAEKESADLVICDFLMVNESGTPLQNDNCFFHFVTEDKSKLFASLDESWRLDMAWNKLYKKSIFDNLRFEYGKIHEDEFAIHHILWKCHRAAFIDQRLYFYRIRNNSIMSSPSLKSRLDQFEALVEQYEFSLQHHLPPRKLLFSNAYINEIFDLKKALCSQELPRYKELRTRHKKCYFRNQNHQTVSGLLRYCFYVKGWPARRYFKQLRKWGGQKK